jgi:hypothetical protein
VAQDVLMGEIINLRLVKKQRERAQKAAEAAAARAQHGRDKEQKAQDAGEKSRLRLLLDNARLDQDPPKPS